MDQLLDATGSPGYRALDDAGRHRMLAEADAVAGAAVGLESLTPETADLMRTLTLTQRLANAGESRALGQLIVSMTHQPTDVLAVVWLLKVAALRVGMADPAPLPVVPLFETIDDLHRAHVMFDALLDDPHYRQHVRRGGERMTCMLGYSDSAKDGGYLASNWALYQTQDRLASRARDRGVTLTMFHGRGGALGRGGGPAARAIISLPSHAVDGRLRITEQGEVIAERYDDPSIAQRHLEQLLWATLRQSYSHHNGVPADAHQFARHMADLSLQAYRKFVESPHFADYLRQCTALPLIEKLPIGSRPSRRTAAARLEDLRAIPFTFAWNQVRMPINAFYGLGSAFEALDPTQKKRASELYKAWPWFRAVIDNAELALARCDPAITRRYAQLGPDQTWAMELWQMLCNEFEAARRAVLAIKQESDIIEAVPWLQRTIRIRNPYLDLLNLIQVELMSRLARETAEGDQRPIDEALRLTVQSIAAGLRNTG
jgi:phosphoenolpyruvate carboxylase